MSTDEPREMAVLHNYISMLPADRADTALEEAIADANVLAAYISKAARSNVAIRNPILPGRSTFEAKVTAAYNRARARLDG